MLSACHDKNCAGLVYSMRASRMRKTAQHARERTKAPAEGYRQWNAAIFCTGSPVIPPVLVRVSPWAFRALGYTNHDTSKLQTSSQRDFVPHCPYPALIVAYERKPLGNVAPPPNWSASNWWERTGSRVQYRHTPECITGYGCHLCRMIPHPESNLQKCPNEPHSH